MNVSVGAATANLAELLGTFVTMHIPKIAICDSTALVSTLCEEVNAESMYYVTKQLFSGKFGGECMFLINDDSAIHLGKHLYDMDDPSQDDIFDAVIELTNNPNLHYNQPANRSPWNGSSIFRAILATRWSSVHRRR
jgi:chemotaxis protein CheC